MSSLQSGPVRLRAFLFLVFHSFSYPLRKTDNGERMNCTTRDAPKSLFLQNKLNGLAGTCFSVLTDIKAVLFFPQTLCYGTNIPTVRAKYSMPVSVSVLKADTGNQK